MSVQSGIRQLGGIKKYKRPCYLLIHKRRSLSHLECFSLADDAEVQPIGNFLNEDDLKYLRLALVKHGLLEINQEWWKPKTTVNRLHY